MKRKTYTSDSQELSDRTPDEILQRFSDHVDAVDPSLRSKETEERTALFLNATTVEIFCTTRAEYRAYRFVVENGMFHYKNMQGDFRQ